MPKKFNQEICDVVGALDAEEVPVKEIQRRLNHGEAGLDHKHKIGERTVYEYRDRARDQVARSEALQDPAAHSIAALKLRIRERFAQEIAHLEKLPIGKLNSKARVDLHHCFIKLDDMERREQKAQKRQGGSKLGEGQGGSPKAEESTVERMAREQREGPPQT